MKTQAAIRATFWLAHPSYGHLYRPGRRQNDYPVGVRMAFVSYVDSLARSGEITQKLAITVTL